MIFLVRRGNLTETPIYTLFALLLGIAVTLICVYVAFLQGYIMLVEKILSCIQIGFIIIESILAIVTLASFSR